MCDEVCFQCLIRLAFLTNEATKVRRFETAVDFSGLYPLGLWSVHITYSMPVGWPTAVLHWQALCSRVPAKAASWRTVVVGPFLRWRRIHPPERPEDNDRVTARRLKRWAQSVCSMKTVTCGACSCVEIHTMTPAVSCNKSLASLQAHLWHFGYCLLMAATFSLF